MFSQSNSTTEGGGGRGTGESLAADGQHALSEPPSAHRPLALPAPGEGTQVEQEGATTLEVGGESVKMDKLGPLIVNSDGVSPSCLPLPSPFPSPLVS